MWCHSNYCKIPSQVQNLFLKFFLGKIEGKERRGWQRTSWLDGITDSVDMILSKLREMVKDRGTWSAALQFSLVQFSPPVLSDSVTSWTAARQASLFITSSWSALRLMSMMSWWCHPTISSSIVLFSSLLQSFPASGSFPMRQVAKILEFQLQHQFFQWIFRTDFL